MPAITNSTTARPTKRSPWAHPEQVARNELLHLGVARTCPWNRSHNNLSSGKMQAHIASCTFRPQVAWMCAFYSSHGYGSREERDAHYSWCSHGASPFSTAKRTVSFKTTIRGKVEVQVLGPTQAFLEGGRLCWPHPPCDRCSSPSSFDKGFNPWACEKVQSSARTATHCWRDLSE
jgi:hypothetical protein